MYRSIARRKPAQPIPAAPPPALTHMLAEREAEISRLTAVLATIDEGRGLLADAKEGRRETLVTSALDAEPVQV